MQMLWKKDKKIKNRQQMLPKIMKWSFTILLNTAQPHGLQFRKEGFIRCVGNGKSTRIQGDKVVTPKRNSRLRRVI
jgi:hypothetical protein